MAYGKDPTIIPIDLQCELHPAPLWIDIQNPRFSWSYSSEVSHSWSQGSYQIEVMDSEGAVCWNSGSVRGKKSFSVVYAG